MNYGTPSAGKLARSVWSGGKFQEHELNSEISNFRLTLIQKD
jgi:DNA-binding winged helix-turn-helix (wHTH) protein